MERRSFLRKWVRVAILAGTAGALGYLTLSGKVAGKPDDCSDKETCGNCPKAGLCKHNIHIRDDKDGK